MHVLIIYQIDKIDRIDQDGCSEKMSLHVFCLTIDHEKFVECAIDVWFK